MGECSFPNPADDLRSRMVYTAATEFIHRLDRLLQSEQEHAADGSLSVDTILVVQECCEAAQFVLCSLVSSWEQGFMCRLPEFNVRPDQFPGCSPKAVDLVVQALRVLTSKLPATPHALTPSAAVPAKWELMSTLGTQFFLQFGSMAAGVLRNSGATVDDFDRDMIRGCLDAAMGMVYELMSEVWPDGQEAPARAVLAMHDHVISCRLADSGHEAVSLIRYVYDAVTSQVREEH